MINIIASGSKGNAIIYHKEILVDVGVAYKHIEPYLDEVKYILLTHAHTDHYKPKIIKRIQKNYPHIQILGGEWFVDKVTDLFVINCNTWYQLEGYQISAFDVYHDVENVGYRIFKELPDFEHHKLIHVTDTYSLDGVEAVGYDLYCVEHNHYEDIINQAIAEKQMRGVFAYEVNARDNHMSYERAESWLKLNNTNNAEVIKLHISTKNGVIKDE